MNATDLIVRKLPSDLTQPLDQEKQRRGISLNQTVIDLLRQSLGVNCIRSNGVGRLAGTWTEAEHEEFLAAMRGTERIDQDLWM